jgi:hypothetical protein
MKRLFVLTSVILFLGLSMNVYAADEKDVNVVNTPDVNVVNQPTVRSEQSGSWEVNVNNTTSNPIPIDGAVEIINSDPIPVQTEHFPREPFYKGVTIQGTAPVIPGYVVHPDDIPPGEILVVESINYWGFLSVGLSFSYFAFKFIPASGDDTRIWMPPLQYDEGNPNHFQDYVPVRLYLRDDDALVAYNHRFGDSGFNTIINVTVTGYLRPEDSPSLSP